MFLAAILMIGEHVGNSVNFSQTKEKPTIKKILQFNLENFKIVVMKIHDILKLKQKGSCDL